MSLTIIWTIEKKTKKEKYDEQVREEMR